MYLLTEKKFMYEKAALMLSKTVFLEIVCYVPAPI